MSHIKYIIINEFQHQSNKLIVHGILNILRSNWMSSSKYNGHEWFFEPKSIMSIWNHDLTDWNGFRYVFDILVIGATKGGCNARNTYARESRPKWNTDSSMAVAGTIVFGSKATLVDHLLTHSPAHDNSKSCFQSYLPTLLECSGGPRSCHVPTVLLWLLTCSFVCSCGSVSQWFQMPISLSSILCLFKTFNVHFR